MKATGCKRTRSGRGGTLYSGISDRLFHGGGGLFLGGSGANDIVLNGGRGGGLFLRDVERIPTPTPPPRLSRPPRCCSTSPSRRGVARPEERTTYVYVAVIYFVQC